MCIRPAIMRNLEAFIILGLWVENKDCLVEKEVTLLWRVESFEILGSPDRLSENWKARCFFYEGRGTMTQLSQYLASLDQA